MANRNSINNIDALERNYGSIEIANNLEVNCILNTGYPLEHVNISETAMIEYNSNPVSTTFDKALYLGASLLYFQTELKTIEQPIDNNSMMFALIYLLQIVQDKELSTGKTIDVDKITLSSNIMDAIYSSWDFSEQEFIISIEPEEYESLKRILRKRDAMRLRYQEEQIQCKALAEKTEKEWALFLELANDISQREKDVIKQINEAGTKGEKKRVINEYRNILLGIDRGRYSLNGNDVNLFEVLLSAGERINEASIYASAQTKSGEPFRVNPVLFLLVKKPLTFNYLFMTFHLFRLSPSKETAKLFFSQALYCIKKNLGGECREGLSVDGMIEDFYITVSAFMDQIKDVLDSISFSTIQNDSVVFDKTAVAINSADMYFESLSKRVEKMIQDGEYEKSIERLINGQGGEIPVDKLLSHMQGEEQLINEIEKQALAIQIVVSLNIIYLFCDALKRVLKNKHANVKIKDVEKVENYRRELLRIDDRLVHTVYSDLGDQEMGMLEYRENSGIISDILSEQESHEGTLRNDAFAGILRDNITELVSQIEKQDIEGIIETKKRIKKEIFRFPECEGKDQYADWIDEISTRISEALVANCKQDENKYSTVRSSVIENLGSNSSHLPDTVIDSLTTAELLYEQYATEKYAEEGFDYSCISALYYQAFEDAYNSLIWHGYADMLNSLMIDDKPFTTILEECRKGKINVKAAKGYLDPDSFGRGNYVTYPKKHDKEPKTFVKPHCMYMNFYFLMNKVEDNGVIPKFCDYFAKLAAFSNKEEMFSDYEFMAACKELTEGVKKSADNRNNASHGGTFISREQCKSDKKTVLYDLEDVRSISIGLVQQLLSLLFR